ncbi:MAG: RHS repeat-associated core domain-containing protein [Clostridia bacterium]
MTKRLWQKNSFIKTIALLCIIVMVFCFAPMNVFAYTLRENLERKESISNTPIVEKDVEQEKSYKNQKIVAEETEKRTKNEKHYILEDGTRVAAIFPSNVHYLENGNFLDIDNTLEAKNDTKEILKLTAEEMQLERKDETTKDTSAINNNNLAEIGEKNKQTQVYENKSNSYKTIFTNKTKEYNLGSITSQNNTLTWRLKNANSTNSPIIKNPTSNKNIKGLTIDELEINQTSSTIEYTNILDNVNIEYSIAPEEIKEAIILKNKNAISNKIVFEYNTNGLEMKLAENNDIIVYKNKEDNVKFTIKAPFMYDRKLEFSDKIEIKLKKQGKKYLLTLIPNKQWLEDSNRVYPVIIDPTIQTSLYVQDINDTFIYKNDTNNTTRHNAHILRVGNGGGNPSRSLIKFTLPTLNSGDQVIAAELSIKNYPDTSEWNPPTEERIFDVHRITSSWTASSANWSNTSSKYDTRVIDYIKYKYDTSNPRKDNRFDITTLVKDWYTTGNNYGVMLKEHNEYYQESGTDAYFYSADTSGTYTNCRPSIIIAYRNQTGIESYLSYHTQTIGRAGVIYTNDYNGNLTLIHTDASTPGNRLPVTIEHIYNTNEKDTDIGYGKGIRLNLAQTIELKTISSVEYLKYIDEDATAHYFKKDSTTNIYEDEDGLGLTITTSGDNKIMTDKSGNTMTFVKYSSGNKWHLKEVKDTSGNKITLTLTTYNNQYLISQVEDAAGDKITLTYSSGKLQKITDKAGKITTYAYDSSSRLTTITYSDNKTSTYTYGSKNELTRVKNIDNSYLDYTYYPGSVYRVKNITEYGTDATQGNSLTITYGNNLTKFTDEQGYSNTYTFDNYGHCITIADFGKEAENIDNAYGIAYKYGTSGGTNNKLTLESKLVSVKDLSNNLIQNPCFNDGTNNWNKSNLITDDKIVSLNGNNVFKITGETGKTKHLMQEINMSGSAGEIYTLYGWAKSKGVPNEVDESLAGAKYITARILIQIIKNDGTRQYENVMVVNGTDGWQFLSKQFITNSDYQQIKVYLMFDRNANEIYYDNIGLFKEEFGTSYQYDSKGNVVSTQNLAKQNNTFRYDSNNNLIQSTNPKGGGFTYEYDTTVKNRLLSATNSNYVKYAFTYDNYGNATSSKITNAVNGEQYIESKATYTANGNYTTKIENQLGKETTYAYNTNTGTLSTITDPKGNTVNYTYDSLNRISSSQATNGTKTHTNTYTYENDKLKTINHNGYNYSFIYDVFGNQKQVKVGNQLLITNSYGTKNGNLTQSTYGNGQQITYNYDRFNRLTKKSGTTGDYNYIYDGRGNLKQIQDNVNGNVITYAYDLAERVAEKIESKEVYRQNYTYDNNNNISSVESHLNNFSRNINYTYNSNNIIEKVNTNNFEITYNNDDLLRTYSKQIKNNNNNTYNVGYTYKNLSNGRTTTQVTSLTNGNEQALNYTYDNNGNIETISKGTELKQKYYYDALGQLIRENDKDQNKTITYEYDAGGNIINKKEYQYTTESALPQATNTITYTYGNTNWKDQLTSYNSKTITYDAIGNPLTYDGNTYVWQNGRQLASITNNSQNLSVEYKYNDNGIRTEKTIGTTTTYYLLEGSNIIFQRTIDNILYFDYDESGQVIGVTYYNKSTNQHNAYIYKKNIQGDIIGILDENLNEVARYTYDSWGKVLSITDANGTPITDANHIANRNPFRYRGYYYDTETGLYYLQSRYYNPEWGRFLNADSIISDTILGTNLYAYCQNNPIYNCDPDGKIVRTLGMAVIIILGVAAIINVMNFVATIDWSWINNINFSTSSSNNSKVTNSDTVLDVDYAGTVSKGKGTNYDDYDDYDDRYLNDKIKKNNRNNKKNRSIEAKREKVGKIKGNTPGNNQVQNRQTNYLSKKYKLTHNQQRNLHEAITKKGLGYKEIQQVIKEIF